ncbi:MAG: hypothetical protein H7Z20_07900 [Bdellovibrio sp.]|nr:hypothetical protein [Methylotenera sp.]
MKITVYVLIAVFLASSFTAFAETPKKDIIDAQQAETQETIDAAKNAKPQVETRPAATAEHTKNAEVPPKAEMVKAQEAATNKAIEDAKAAKPDLEARPAAITKYKKHSVQSPKGEMIKHNKIETHKAIKDAEAAAKPANEVLPAVK